MCGGGGERGCIIKDKNRKKLSTTKKDTSLYIKRIHQLFRNTKRPPQRYSLMKFYGVPRIKDTKNFYKKIFHISEEKKYFMLKPSTKYEGYLETYSDMQRFKRFILH